MKIRTLNAKTGEYVFEDVSENSSALPDPPSQPPSIEDRISAVENAILNLMG